VDAPNQGLKKPFAFERQEDNVVGFEVKKKLKCLFIGLSYSSCMWVAIKFLFHVVCPTFQICKIDN
jgi:hypothetical protein